MPQPEMFPKTRVAYVLKRYPRYSETFIVNEILAHEAAGQELRIVSLYPPSDSHFQDALARVRAPVTYLTAERLKTASFWETLQGAQARLPGVTAGLELTRGEDVRHVYQALRLAVLAQQEGITHFHAHFGTAATSVARLAASFAGLGYTFTAHAKDIFHESVDPEDLRRKLEDAAAVVTVSDYNLAFLRDHYGRTARLQRIYNGMDLSLFPYAEPRGRPPHIVAVGRLVEKKGFGDLVEACAVLAERGRDFRCLVIGTGPLEAELRAQVMRLGLTGKVQLLGPRPQRELAAFLQGAAAFAAPCVVGADGNRDGLPTVLLEAMALGTPCVSTDVTGIPEILRHEETGLRVPQRRPEKLADALSRLMADASLRVRLARRARALVERDFDITRNAAALREVFAAAQPFRSVGRPALLAAQGEA